MLRYQTDDGETVTLDLRDPDQARSWLRASRRQDGLSALSVVASQFTTTLPRPHGFRSVQFDAQTVERSGRVRGGERLILYADDVRLTLMVHAEQPSVRVALAKVGKRTFDPERGR